MTPRLLASATHPTLYEINTWVWLDRLSRWTGATVTLATVPDATWDELAALGADAVWLMGVWERSPAGTALALADPERRAELVRALPDLIEADIVGSPYCVRRYRVDDRLGGPDGLAVARRQLADRGLGLVLDIVPNHVAPDHPWALEHPERFVGGTEADLAADAASFLRVGDHVLARGRDPYFPAWPDVVQLDPFAPTLRTAAAEQMVAVLDQCDGVRCDMAMLLLSDVVTRTWGGRVGPPPATEYWADVLGEVRRHHHDAWLIAEAYWDLEWRLQQLGFDHCYDKRLYDRVLHDDAEAIRGHLGADEAYQAHLLRFLENHDEPRAASVLAPERAGAAAVVALTQTGARLVHDGQVEGRTVHLPVFLGREPDEPSDDRRGTELRRLLAVLRDRTFHTGTWDLCERWGGAGDDHWAQLLAWAWTPAPGDGGSRWLVVVNHGADGTAGHVRAPEGWADVRGGNVALHDHWQQVRFDRAGDDLLDGLYVRLDGWGVHLLQLDPSATTASEEQL